jgi:DNA sulfur modification protein DndD
MRRFGPIRSTSRGTENTASKVRKRSIDLAWALTKPYRGTRLIIRDLHIIAIAVLWGLARASARQLPAVIDMPMARLDAAHRRHLVERYFPNASHQVVIFSTDTEVDRRAYQALQPYIARTYHLNYVEATHRTVGEEGYSWTGV